MLIDASGIAYRAFATSSPVHRESDGEPIGAALRFMEITWRMVGSAEAGDKPTHGAAVFDVPGPNFRHKLYPAYKSNRDPARGLILGGQMPYMKHAAETMGLFPIEADGFEADDVIATLALLANAQGMRVTIVSSDKDFGQLVVDGVVEIVDPMQKRRVLAADVEKKFGVKPAQIADFQALAGDAVDGYPGIKGCGGKHAAGLIRAWGSLDGVIKNIDRVQPIGVRHALSKNIEKAKIFRKLARLRRDVPTAPNVIGLMVMQPVMKSHLAAILKAIEAPAWALSAVFGVDRQDVRTVPGMTDKEAMAWWREELRFPPQRLPDIPQCGFYKRRLVKGGAEVAARIWRGPLRKDQTQELFCEVGGQARDPFAEWARLAMQPIEEKTYHYMIADADHARKWRPGDPKADPRKRVNPADRPKSTNPRRKSPL